MIIRKNPHLTIWLLVMLAALFGCQPSPQQEASPPDQVSVQLKWVHQAQFTGFYAAETQGFYADENLQVIFIPAGIGIDVFDGVLNKNNEFAVVSAENIISRRAGGAPVKAIATTYQINPVVWVAFADSGITSPRDFIGRAMAVNMEFDGIQLRAVLNKLDLDLNQIELHPYSYDNAAFLNGEVDATVSFAAGSFLPLKEAVGSRELVLIWPDDYGVHFYSDTIIAHDDLVAQNPDLVLRFLRATLKGHSFVIENPELALDATMLYADAKDKDLQAEMLEASVPLVHTGKNPVGWMEAEVWSDMQDILFDQGIITKKITVEDLMVMDFLNIIYGSNE